jgi:hypothetical protein
MGHEKALEGIEAAIREHEEAIAVLRESFRKISGLGPSDPLEGGRVKKPPLAWKTADDIQILLEDGKVTMPKDQLIQILVDRNLVGGKTVKKKYESALLAITNGATKGYLRVEGNGENALVQWIPGERENKRVSRKGWR